MHVLSDSRTACDCLLHLFIGLIECPHLVACLTSCSITAALAALQEVLQGNAAATQEDKAGFVRDRVGAGL
jgi:hypothetical protein